MNTTIQCCECGTPLTEPALDGLCPKCLLGLGVATKVMKVAAAEPAGTAWDGTLREAMEFGPYRVLRLLGQGGMGSVYEAEDRRSGRRVALKVLGKFFDSAEMRQRFLREGQLAASVRHPNVVAVLAAEEIDGVAVIAMELVAAGTLRDRVKARGPGPISEAVETTLQIIAGLEEAHAHGVLHRDVKPANCFVGNDGTVKVGDFGLSISTLARQDVHLTQTGTILGTPAFASPEQLRGAEVDVRSDIYAVGATLYFLLAGRPTHDAESLPALIAAVLEQMPADPHSLRREVPRELSRIVMRCLAKNPALRFSSYAELCEALLPFTSTAATPATLGLRFAAGCIDVLVSVIPFLAWMLFTGDYPLDALLLERTGLAMGVSLLSMLWFLFYGTLFEGVWGMTPGKAVCGLRVVRLDNGLVPGCRRAAVRAFFFSVLPDLARHVTVLTTTSAAEFSRRSAETFWGTVDWIPILILLALFLTMRRRNGFAAVHDLITATRVVNRLSARARPRLVSAAAATPALGGAQIGPYAVVGREGDWSFAWDEALRRAVWIRHVAAGTPPVAIERRDLNRVTRLRWLNGQRSETENWDAYEAPAGTPLTARMDRTQPWSHVRFWAHDVADELAAAQADGTLPAKIGASHVWLTSSGRAVLLEFAAPGSPPSRTYDPRSLQEVPQFLDEILSASVDPRLPLHARNFLDALRRQRFETAAVIAGNLRALLDKAAEVTINRRLLGFAIPIGGALFIAVAAFLMLVHVNRDFDAMWQRDFPGRPSPRLALDLHAADVFPDEIHDNLRLYLAGHYGDVMRQPEFWERSETIAVTYASTRKFAQRAMQRFPAVAPERLAAADAALREPLREMQLFDRALGIWMPATAFVMLLGMLQLLAAFPSPWLKAPLGLRWLGFALVRKDGAPASAWRIALRSAIAVLPILCATVAASVILNAPTVRPAWYVLIGSCVLLLIGLIGTLFRPDRTPADILAGTCLVTR